MSFKFSISKQSLFWLFLLVWFLELPYFSTISFLDNVFSIGKILSFLVLIIYIYRKNDFQLSHFAGLIILFEVLFVIITLYRNGLVNNRFITAITYITFVLLLEYMIRCDANKVLSILLYIFEIIIYANFITVILFPKGIYNVSEDSMRFYWLTGHQNTTILYVLCAIVVAVLYSTYVKRAEKVILRSKLLIGIGCTTIFIIWSATAVLGLVVLLVVILASLMKIRLNAKQAIGVSIIVFFAIVVFNMQESLETIITSIFKRDVTLSNRTRIWDRALFYIEQFPWIGYGLESSLISKARFGLTSCHNKYLQVLYQGGVVLISVFLWLLVSVAKKIDEYIDNAGVNVIIGVVWALLIQMQFESYTTVMFYIPLILGVNIDKISESNSFVKER